MVDVMSEYENMRTADIVSDALLDWKVNVIFGLPGDGINGFMEALRQRQNKIRFVPVRHEKSGAFMACAYAKYTGKLGACVATSGPGAIHLLNGLYDAKADNTPVIAITGTTYLILPRPVAPPADRPPTDSVGAVVDRAGGGAHAGWERPA